MDSPLNWAWTFLLPYWVSYPTHWDQYNQVGFICISWLRNKGWRAAIFLWENRRKYLQSSIFLKLLNLYKFLTIFLQLLCSLHTRFYSCSRILISQSSLNCLKFSWSNINHWPCFYRRSNTWNTTTESNCWKPNFVGG